MELYTHYKQPVLFYNRYITVDLHVSKDRYDKVSNFVIFLEIHLFQLSCIYLYFK